MKALAETLEMFAPPRWLMLGLAAALATTLLAAFVDTLRDNARRGEQLRAEQRVSSVRQAVSTMADAGQAGQRPQLRQASSSTLQR